MAITLDIGTLKLDFYPWCASPLSGLTKRGREIHFKFLLKNYQNRLTANAGAFSQN